ncbi:MAG: carboxypeptidase regulatory-like domain-containing protein, partial [Acidobacteria bacterium]|nr:carboxypeptidase regulatory-like domain-containing protein [Acidobacteriota bacterium]
MKSIRLACLAALLAAPWQLDAQVLKGQILGTVTDQSGGVVPGVKLTITETRTNFQRNSETNEA